MSAAISNILSLNSNIFVKMETISLLTPEMQLFLVIVFALIFGSFASLISYRLASKQPMVFARSHCVSCHKPLGIRNLIPLFSWIIQCGKCSFCKAKISWRYPLIELAFVAAFLTVYFTLDRHIDQKMILYFLITGTLIVMTIVDLEHFFIPDVAQYFLAFLVIILSITQGGPSAALINVKAAFLYMGFGLLLFAFFYFTVKVEAIGIDDIKFFFIAGLLLGTADFLAFMMISGIIGVLFGTLWRHFKKEEIFPFAPALCTAMFLCMLFDKKINPVDLMGSMLFFQ